MSAKPSEKPDDFVEQKPPCAHVNDIMEIKATVNEIKTALVGNESLGHRGLFVRMSVVEKILLVLSGCIMLLGGDRVVKLFF
jgi:hypothetical protein